MLPSLTHWTGLVILPSDPGPRHSSKWCRHDLSRLGRSKLCRGVSGRRAEPTVLLSTNHFRWRAHEAFQADQNLLGVLIRPTDAQKVGRQRLLVSPVGRQSRLLTNKDNPESLAAHSRCDNRTHRLRLDRPNLIAKLPGLARSTRPRRTGSTRHRNRRHRTRLGRLWLSPSLPARLLADE